MIRFDLDAFHFNFRVAGVALHDRHVLAHRADFENFWTLPGGRAELGETTTATLQREMREELGADVTVGRLLWVVENFFEYENQDWHEIAFYYVMELPSASPYLDVSLVHGGREENVTLYFKWLPLSDLARVRLYPSFLRERLSDIPAQTEHIVHTDLDLWRPGLALSD